MGKKRCTKSTKYSVHVANYEIDRDEKSILKTAISTYISTKMHLINKRPKGHNAHLSEGPKIHVTKCCLILRNKNIYGLWVGI